jgi:UPF0716 protein FxsA
VTAPGYAGGIRRRPSPILPGLAALLLAEVVVLILVGQWLGVLPTIGLLVAGSIVGGLLLRHQGTRAWRAFVAAVNEGRPPHREALDGMLVVLGGALILLPGFVSDVLGLLCLLPPTRRLLGRGLTWYALRRGGVGVLRVRARRGPGLADYRVDPPTPPPGRVIEGDTDKPPGSDPVG